MRDNHGLRYNPTERTRIATNDLGEELHQKITGSYFLVTEGKITPLSTDAAHRWMEKYTGGIVSKPSVSHSKTTAYSFTVPWELYLSIRDYQIHYGLSPKKILIHNVEEGDISRRKCEGDPVKMAVRVSAEEMELIDKRAAEEGMSRNGLIVAILTAATVR